MRGDVVFRVYGVHDGRVDDRSSGTFRTRAAAEAEIEDLLSREVGGENWARRYRNGGFVIRDQVVSTDFDIPPRPSPRDSYVVSTSPKPKRNGLGLDDRRSSAA